MRFLLALIFSLVCSQVFADSYNYFGISKPVGAPCAFLNTSSTNVTTSAWVQIVASTAASFSSVHVTNTGSSVLKMAIGGSGSEVDAGVVIPASAVGIFLPWNVAKSSRISLEALGATQSSGYVSICYFQ